MKVEISGLVQKRIVKIGRMEPGEIGVLLPNQSYTGTVLSTREGVYLLENVNMYWRTGLSENPLQVEILPRGTAITLTI